MCLMICSREVHAFGFERVRAFDLISSLVLLPCLESNIPRLPAMKVARSKEKNPLSYLA